MVDSAKNVSPVLERVVTDTHRVVSYDDLPDERWCIPDIGNFSREKVFYDYQRDALKQAAQALHYYYGRKGNVWQASSSLTDKPPDNCEHRKQDFAGDIYGDLMSKFAIPQYKTRQDETYGRKNPVFKILEKYFKSENKVIPYWNLINRMCFWMATGSGKTMVMVKIIEYLHRLKKGNCIPNNEILVLTSGDHLIEQIRSTIDEFNKDSDWKIDFVPLRDWHVRQSASNGAKTVYYHRSDNISDEQKESIIDYSVYQNGGKWYVLLDEAHKGIMGESKRQAYYALMARNGFLFNFSATFTDPEDIVTTVKKYNLEEFVKNGYGKNIYLNEAEFRNFNKLEEEISDIDKRKIMLKSLITLACVRKRALELREKNPGVDLYHMPLMMTLVNSVNTVAEKNDLLAFFLLLRGIASGDVDEQEFGQSKQELRKEWSKGSMQFSPEDGDVIGDDKLFEKLTIDTFREAVFGIEQKGALQYIRGQGAKDVKEVAFQLKNAAAPFGLIRIGDISKWQNEFLAGFEETKTLREKSFFEGLDKENDTITILMGSRAFIEGWDTTRPNVINFINIGKANAQKFVTQAIGRGVRIAPLPDPNCRRRLSKLGVNQLNKKEKRALESLRKQVVAPVETLFLFATDKAAVKGILKGLGSRQEHEFVRLENFEIAARPPMNGGQMPLFIPEYKKRDPKCDDTEGKIKFRASEESLGRLEAYLDARSDALLAIRNNLATEEIDALRSAARNCREDAGKDYARIPFMLDRLVYCLRNTEKVSEKVRELDEEEDIVHFREIRARRSYVERTELNEKIRRVAKGRISDEKHRYLAGEYIDGNLSKKEFEKERSEELEISLNGLTIKNIVEHYYLPIVIAENGGADYIKHIVKVESEARFLEKLTQWLETNEPQWEAWMFSKIDESLDKNIYIPYYGEFANGQQRFRPDFIFWMCKGDCYRIVFVDPKGAAHASVYRKIDGYSEIFEKNGKCRRFRADGHSKLKVSVRLMLINPQADDTPTEYTRFWHKGPEVIFEHEDGGTSRVAK